MQKYIYVLSMVTENSLRVLQRMAGIFARQRVNIEQLSVFETPHKGVSCFNVMILGDERVTHRIIMQLQRIMELHEVKINCRIPLSPTVDSGNR